MCNCCFHNVCTVLAYLLTSNLRVLAEYTPLLKKPDLDSADPKSYRPIANLSVLSKLLERLVVRQLLDHLNAARLLPELQSAYRAHHSTETAVTKVLADILLALDTGDLSMLTLLDLSAAFDTNHNSIISLTKTNYSRRSFHVDWTTATRCCMDLPTNSDKCGKYSRFRVLRRD